MGRAYHHHRTSAASPTWTTQLSVLLPKSSINMYRPRYYRWRLFHILSMLAHLALLCAGSVAFIYDSFSHVSNPTMQQLHKANFRMTDTSHDPYPFRWADIVVDEEENWRAVDATIPDSILLLTCISLGGFGLVINITVFCLLLSLDTNKVTLTEGQQHWRKQVVTLFGSVLNIVLAAAGVGLVGLLGVRVAESKSMIIPLVWATIQAPLALSTAIFDAIKNYREGKDLLD